MAPLPKNTKPKDAAVEWISTQLKDLLLAQDDQEGVERKRGCVQDSIDTDYQQAQEIDFLGSCNLGYLQSTPVLGEEEKLP